MYSATGLSAFILLFACVIGLIAILGTIFWIWMIVDCAANEPPQSNDKLMWILIIVLTHFVGASIYYFVRRPERRRIVGR